MSLLFYCDGIKPYRPQHLSHEDKFNKFMSWASFPQTSNSKSDDCHDLDQLRPSFAVQLVRQVNFGPLESKRYFIPNDTGEGQFVEVIENDLIQANFKKLNTYKNYKCQDHGKFFEVNVYQKDPVNNHHWRADIARPGGSIDL